MSNIDELIEQLRKSADFEDYPIVASFAAIIEKKYLREAADALSTLQAENAQLRGELEYEREHANAYHEECGQWEAENEKLRAELEEVKRVLAMMWYAYENKDGEAPHEYEIEARRAADKVLGPWAECMPKYLRNSQESSLCDTCAHTFDEVCKGCSDGNRYEPKAPEEPVRIIDEITEFTRDQWDWLMGRFTRKED